MKFLVTGAAGFVGFHLAKSLASEGHQIDAVDDFNDYYAPALKRLRSNHLLSTYNLQTHDFSLEDASTLSGFIEKSSPDIVIHLAAQPGVRLEITEYEKYTQRNLVSFSNILQASVINEIPNFLYASSSSVYGNHQSEKFSESMSNLVPISYYGATKLAGEVLAKTLVRESNTRARGLRFFTAYGPWGRPDMAYFRLIASLVSDFSFERFGDGNVKRDFTFISELIDISTLLAKELVSHDRGFHDVVNIGGGNAVSLNEMISEVEKLLEKKVSMIKSPMNLNDVDFTSADTTYLESLIGKRPTTRIEQGLSEVINWSIGREVHPFLGDWARSVG